MNKQQIEIRQIDNALKKEDKLEALKVKHGITGTKNQQRVKLEDKKEEYELDK